MHNYKKFKSDSTNIISKFHSLLEFNSRCEQSLLNYIWNSNSVELRTNYYQINCERLGDLTIYKEKL